MCHSVTRLTLCPFFLNSHKCLCVIRNYLTWCHWLEDEGLVMELETIDVAMPIMRCLFVVLPWAPKEHVTHCHWHHITLNDVSYGPILNETETVCRILTL